MTHVLEDRVKVTLATGVDSIATSFVLLSGDGAAFPAIPAGDYVPAYIETSFDIFEKVHVTAVTGDTLTVVRNQGGTARSWSAGTKLFVTPGVEEFDTLAVLQTDVVFKSLTTTYGTTTADDPLIDGSQTWNNAAVTFTALKVAITDTASAANSLLLDLQVGGSSILNVTKNGWINGTLFVDETNERVGIGIDTPYAQLVVRSQNTGNTRGIAIEHVDDTTALSQAKFVGRRSRGSHGSPSAVLANDSLVSLNGAGYKATGWSDTVGGFYVHARENWTDTATGTFITLRGPKPGTTTPQEWARFQSDSAQLTPEWTAAGTTYTALKVNPTNTASADASLLMDLQIGGTSVFKVGRLKSATMNGTFELKQTADPGTPPSGSAYLYVADNGDGTSRLVVKMPDGAVTTLANEVGG